MYFLKNVTTSFIFDEHFLWMITLWLQYLKKNLSKIINIFFGLNLSFLLWRCRFFLIYSMISEVIKGQQWSQKTLIYKTFRPKSNLYLHFYQQHFSLFDFSLLWNGYFFIISEYFGIYLCDKIYEFSKYIVNNHWFLYAYTSLFGTPYIDKKKTYLFTWPDAVIFFPFFNQNIYGFGDP